MKLNHPHANEAAQRVDGERHKTCGVCKQAYDAHDFAQHSHHTDQPHEPLPDDAPA